MRSSPILTAPGRRGMTLLEVMLAIAILVAGLLTVFAMLNAGIRNQRRARNETEAACVAAAVLAETRAHFFHNEVVLSNKPNVFNPSPEFPNYEYNRLVIPLTPARGNAYGGALDKEYFVRVTVRWAGTAETNNSITVNTIVFRQAR